MSGPAQGQTGRTPRQPPAVAAWLLKHLGDPYQREALLGDLIEAHRQGRADAWFWRQTLLAIGTATGRRLSRLSPVMYTYLLWWAVLLFAGITLKSAFLVLAAFDPSVCLLIHRHTKRRRA